MKRNPILLWKKKGKILEGVVNSIFRQEHIEQIAAQRLEICKSNKCGCYDQEGSGCFVPGTQPCCDINKGGCGCKLFLKIRALSEGCPKNMWEAVLTEQEEQALKEKLGGHED